MRRAAHPAMAWITVANDDGLSAYMLEQGVNEFLMLDPFYVAPNGWRPAVRAALLTNRSRAQ